MLGVCYYPEHWPAEQWAKDARMMRELGLQYVRIGEFAWSRIEPRRGDFRFDWLDKAIDTLASEGLKIVFGTPTATPPKWLIDECPDILPVSVETGQTRGFGSRRHYDFSSEVYRCEAMAITEKLVKRYGQNPAIVGWQTDNELCCHDTTLSGSVSAKTGFQAWCAERYGSIDALNAAWGNVFWSMEYNDFSAIELPIQAVTETNPAHRLAFMRYSSDQVVAFHDQMVAIIRSHAPERWVTHNFIPRNDLYMDAYALGAPLDFASYDNYPLGRSDMMFKDAPAAMMQRYMRTGHPDLGCFYQDVVRSFSKGDYWVMEQQPGPVNWANHNPRPLPGMVRFWSLEAFALGAACVSYFRWRAAPFAQEQMHAGLLRSDDSKAAAWTDVVQVAQDIETLGLMSETKEQNSVAIITDIEALWVTDIQPQGQGYDYAKLEFAYYTAFRKLGVDVDFISKEHDFKGYRLIVSACLPIIGTEFTDKCKASEAHFIFGPRSASKTDEFSVPDSLAPGVLQSLVPTKVLSVETLRADCPERLYWGGRLYEASVWCEELSTDNIDIVATYDTGMAAIVRHEKVTYIGTVTDEAFLKDFMLEACINAGIHTYNLPDDLRIIHRGSLIFVFNYGPAPQSAPDFKVAELVLGETTVKARDISIWRLTNNE